MEGSMGGGSQRAARRRYTMRMVLGFAAYAVVLVSAILWLNERPGTPWRIPVALLPMVPIAYLLWSMQRFFREADELQKRILLEGFAFGFAGTAVAVLTYGFLEMAGLPRPSAWWVWWAMGAFWIVGSLLANRAYR